MLRVYADYPNVRKRSFTFIEGGRYDAHSYLTHLHQIHVGGGSLMIFDKQVRQS
jgi:hypothetical protein